MHDPDDNLDALRYASETCVISTLEVQPRMRGIRNLIHPAVSCRWCGAEYVTYPGQEGYCKHCHGPREGGMNG